MGKLDNVRIPAIYAQGGTDYRIGRSKRDNPYPIFSVVHSEWLRGWNDEFQKQPRYETGAM